MNRLLPFLSLSLVLVVCVSPQRARRSATRTVLGTAYLTEGNPEDAILTLQEATSLDRKNAEAWEKLGLAYAAKGAIELAEKAFLRSLRLEERAEARNNYGLMLTGLGRYDEAIEEYQAAVDNISYRNTALALNNMGHAFYMKGDYLAAASRYEDAIRRAPNLCIARFNLGLVRNSTGEDDLALESFRQVIELCGSTAMGAYYQASLILLDGGDIPAACVYLQNILDDAKNSPLEKQASQKYTESCQ
jgi:type IV pilus assembly protein PilF